MVEEQTIQSIKHGDIDCLMEWIEEEKNKFYRIGWAEYAAIGYKNYVIIS